MPRPTLEAGGIRMPGAVTGALLVLALTALGALMLLRVLVGSLLGAQSRSSASCSLRFWVGLALL
jgi:hypothetical protein